MVKRVQEIYGKVPQQVAADAGYGSRENVVETKALGVKKVGLPKKRGMKIEDMTEGTQESFSRLHEQLFSQLYRPRLFAHQKA
jgi:IS5 family transposase